MINTACDDGASAIDNCEGCHEYGINGAQRYFQTRSQRIPAYSVRLTYTPHVTMSKYYENELDYFMCSAKGNWADCHWTQRSFVNGTNCNDCRAKEDIYPALTARLSRTHSRFEPSVNKGKQKLDMFIKEWDSLVKALKGPNRGVNRHICSYNWSYDNH